MRSFLADIDGQTFTDLRSHNFGIPRVVGYGEDALNRVYIVSLSGTVHRLDPATYPPRDAARQGDPPIGDGEGTVTSLQVGGSFDAPVNSAFAPGESRTPMSSSRRHGGRGGQRLHAV